MAKTADMRRRIIKTAIRLFAERGMDRCGHTAVAEPMRLGTYYLGQDVSRDTKSMVRLTGAQAAGKALCLQVYAYYIPPGASREVNVFTYYSADTSMR